MKNLVGFVNKGYKKGAVNGECQKTGIYLPSGKMVSNSLGLGVSTRIFARASV